MMQNLQSSNWSTAASTICNRKSRWVFVLVTTSSIISWSKTANTHIFYEFLEDKDHGDALHIAVYHAFEKIFELKKEN